MSNFLVSLARRSAGLAPLVRARVAPAIVSAGDVGAPAAPSAPPRAGSAAPVGGPVSASPAIHIHVGERQAPLVASTPSLPTASAPEPEGARPPAVESPSMTVVREFERITTPVFVSAPVASFRASSESGPASHALVPKIAAEPALNAPWVAQPSVDLREPGENAIAVSPPVQESPLALPAPASPSLIRETIRESTRVIEHAIEPVIRTMPAPAVPEAELLATAAPRMAEARVPQVEAAESRVVHVRIGSIEIHGAAPVAAAPVAAPAPVAPQSHPSGFDGFARLRSYAQWER